MTPWQPDTPYMRPKSEKNELNQHLQTIFGTGDCDGHGGEDCPL